LLLSQLGRVDTTADRSTSTVSSNARRSALASSVDAALWGTTAVELSPILSHWSSGGTSSSSSNSSNSKMHFRDALTDEALTVDQPQPSTAPQLPVAQAFRALPVAILEQQQQQQ
jgi:hypothetical protein